MPKPRQNETENEFIDRCIPFVLNEGTAINTAQAFAYCQYLWENKPTSLNKTKQKAFKKE
jgi:hypothetical protein